MWCGRVEGPGNVKREVMKGWWHSNDGKLERVHESRDRENECVCRSEKAWISPCVGGREWRERYVPWDRRSWRV